MSEVSITVLPTMQLAIHPHIIAADADHNSAVFKIIQQPASLINGSLRVSGIHR